VSDHVTVGDRALNTDPGFGINGRLAPRIHHLFASDGVAIRI
jgi:hypothetical protein